MTPKLNSAAAAMAQHACAARRPQANSPFNKCFFILLLIGQILQSI
jgi:hypothetical protein